MKTYWVSIRRLKIHEFCGTLRHIKNQGLTWHDIYTRLGELQTAATRRIVKQSSSLLVLYLAISSLSDGLHLRITVAGITASIPTSMAAVVASFSLFVLTQHIISFLMLTLIRSSESSRIKLRGFSANSYGLFYGQDEFALVVPIIQNIFFRDILNASRYLTMILAIVYVIVLVPYVALWGYLFDIQVSALSKIEASPLDIVAAISGIMALLVIALYDVIFNTPLPMRKEKNYVRWAFLSTLYPGAIHPRSKEWLEEEDAISANR